MVRTEENRRAGQALSGASEDSLAKNLEPTRRQTWNPPPERGSVWRREDVKKLQRAHRREGLELMIAAGNAHCYRNDRRTEAQKMNRRSFVASLNWRRSRDRTF